MQNGLKLIAGSAMVATLAVTSCSDKSRTALTPFGGAPGECCSTLAVSKNIDHEASSHNLRSLTATPWLPPNRRVTRLPTELHVTNQDGDAFQLVSLIGEPMAISFFYTRCTNPNKCLRVIQTTADLQATLERAGLGTRTRLILFTYDPEFDEPAMLKSYGESQGFRFGPNAMMLRTDPADKSRLLDAFEIAVNFNPQGVNIHGLQLLLVDAKGFLAREYHTLIWDNDQVVTDLKRLATE